MSIWCWQVTFIILFDLQNSVKRLILFHKKEIWAQGGWITCKVKTCKGQAGYPAHSFCLYTPYVCAAVVSLVRQWEKRQKKEGDWGREGTREAERNPEDRVHVSESLPVPYEFCGKSIHLPLFVSWRKKSDLITCIVQYGNPGHMWVLSTRKVASLKWKTLTVV